MNLSKVTTSNDSQDVIPARKGDTVVWEADRFFTSTVAEPAKPLKLLQWIELQGRQRVAVFGPGITLPSGAWRAAVQFSVDTDGLRIPLDFYWGSDTTGESWSQTFDISGLYELSLMAELTQAEPVQIRIFPHNAMFGGRLQLGRCRVTWL